jgi:hypothetical protein
MQQEPNSRPEVEHLLKQVIASVQPPAFAHPDIVAQYQQGCYTSRLEAELEDILRTCFSREQAHASIPLSLSSQADLTSINQLNCVALIQQGQVLPLLDIEQMVQPLVTLQQRVQLYQAAARTLLEAIAAIYEERTEQRERSQGDDNEGGCLSAR